MLKSLIAALIALSVICPGRADAQAQPDPDTMAAATELIATLRITDQFKQMLPTTMQIIRPLVTQGRPEIEREFDAVAPVVAAALNGRVSELMSQIAGIYARNFTASEMRQLVAFYRAPAGQKFLDKSSVVAQETATIGQNIGRALAGEVHLRMIEELRKQGQKL
jgi:uncharacterized protein